MAPGEVAMSFSPYIAKGRRCNGEIFDFIIADEVGRSWYDQPGELNLSELRWCKDRIGPGATVVDCGAHHGLMSIMFARWAGREGRVYAYEPLPANANVLKENVLINGLKNVCVRAAGLGRGAHRASITFNQGNTVLVDDGSREVSVNIVALDDDIPPETKIDFLKIDAEGSDLSVLEGASRILAQRPFIDLEIHNFLFADRRSTLEKIFAILPAPNWSYEVLPDVGDASPLHIGVVDLCWLAGLHNPHVFLRPR
jgi:FkbM family methyltransferase